MAEFGLPDAPLHLTLTEYGNTVTVSIPVILDTAARAAHCTRANSSSSPVSAAACRWGSPSSNSGKRARLSHVLTPPPSICYGR
ncbi:hypothetical protein [Streptomyces sp. NBC_01808]|uniref:hypothetical protein n=1 Tax=Streptomyces sp. NBC_01808 TaxID=2975947 RepID=UPI002DDC5B3A|nr:hypothetical protein [Streptomyces sp. NBC_01808]